jgi:predicted nucleotidyltransferase
MVTELRSVVATLKAHETELRQLGVRHAAVFGSAARGQARHKLLGGASDVVNRRKLKPLLRDNILREAVNVFLRMEFTRV